MDIMIVGIAVDNYKLEVFKTILTREGFTYDVVGGLTRDTSTIRLQFDNITKATKVVQQCNMAALKLHDAPANTKGI
jgi:phosphoribosylformylglycinamidine (FGAM) synthase-like enzyme